MYEFNGDTRFSPYGSKKLSFTHPMVAEWAESLAAELPFGQGAGDLWPFTTAALHLRQGGAAASAHLPHLAAEAFLLMAGAAAGLAEGPEDLVAAAGIQATGRGRGDKAVRVPVEGELVAQSRGQGVQRGHRLLLLHPRVQGHTGVPRGRPLHTQRLWER